MCSLITVQNENISLTFDLKSGISLVSIRDKVNGNEFLSAPTPLFRISVNGSWEYFSDTSNIFGIQGVYVDNYNLSCDGSKLEISCHPTDQLPVLINLEITAAEGDIAAIVGSSLKNTCNTAIKVKYVNPCIKNIWVPGYSEDPNRMLGMIPMECGNVVTLHNGKIFGTYGIEPVTELPNAFNVMEVANIYDRDGKGGIFFADLDGNLIVKDISPVQFNIKECEASGSWIEDGIAPAETVRTPRIAIGVNHSGNYQTAVDYYVKAHAPFKQSCTSPAWLKEAGGMWCNGGCGSGGIYMAWGYYDLSRMISSFYELPELYERHVEAMGTNLFYLNDYWEGDVPFWPRHYQNKGDYIPRADLGGEEALKKGIEGIHAKGGKVIVYIEPFIILADSKIAREHGLEWAAYKADGRLWNTYDGNYTMLSHCIEWQDHVVKLVQRLVGEYGADGIWLDSYAVRMNAIVGDSKNRMYTAKEWNKGVYQLINKVRSAITAIKPDAVVLSEGGGGDADMCLDGSTTADFAWYSGINDSRIIASPVRYGLPQVNIFTNGTTINHLIQVYAAGHSIALNYIFKEYSDFIKRLLDIRREYKDSMIYGRMYQPDTGNMQVAAYYFTGDRTKVITVANVGNKTQEVNLQLSHDETDVLWTDILTGDVFRLSGYNLPVTVYGLDDTNYGLRVLSNIK